MLRQRWQEQWLHAAWHVMDACLVVGVRGGDVAT